MFEFSQFRDGTVIISSNNPSGMDGDLVFTSGAMSGDPILDKQIELAKFIVESCNASLEQKAAELRVQWTGRCHACMANEFIQIGNGQEFCKVCNAPRR